MSISHSLVLRHEFRPLGPQEPSQPQGGQEPAPFVSREQGAAPVEEQTQEEGKPAKGEAPQMCGPNEILLILGMVAVFYFLMIRPQQKQEKARKAMLGAIKVGDSVITTGGIHGTISSLTEATVVLRVDPKVKMTFDRAHVARVVPSEEAAKEPAD